MIKYALVGAVAIGTVLLVAGIAYLVNVGLVALAQWSMWHMGMKWAADYNTWAAGLLLTVVYSVLSGLFKLASREK